MCFSASASFVAGTALLAMGVATLRMTSQRAEIPLAAIPLLFGVQQITEGLIWLSFRPGSALPNTALTFIYSLFSHVLWPMFVPFAVGRLETVAWRKKAIAACQLAGVAVGLYLLYFLVRFPVTSRVIGGHIVYDSPHFYIVPVLVVYLVSAAVSSLVSSRRIIQVFGAFLLATFVAAYAIHAANLVSIWCFFAAVASCLVFLHFKQERISAMSGGAATVRRATP